MNIPHKPGRNLFGKMCRVEKAVERILRKVVASALCKKTAPTIGRECLFAA